MISLICAAISLILAISFKCVYLIIMFILFVIAAKCIADAWANASWTITANSVIRINSNRKTTEYSFTSIEEVKIKKMCICIKGCNWKVFIWSYYDNFEKIQEQLERI